MIIELFGAPGSGKTFLTKQLLGHSYKNQKFLGREDFATWLKTKDQLFKLRCIFSNLFFSITFSLLLVFLRAAIHKPNTEKLWIPKTVLKEVLLREFMKLNLESAILLDQGNIQRIVFFILFSSSYQPAFVQFILKFMFPMLSRCKKMIFINADTSISTNRVLKRRKDPSISRFDSIDCKDSLHDKISEATQFFLSLAMTIDSNKSKVFAFDNTEEKKLNTSSFDKLIFSILK